MTDDDLHKLIDDALAEMMKVELFFDKDGKPIDALTWGKHFGDRSYQVIEQTTIDDYLVSTVWLGMNHRYSAGPPLIFETMVFWPGDGGTRDMMRYETLDQAKRGHAKFVRELKAQRKELAATLARSGLPTDL